MPHGLQFSALNCASMVCASTRHAWKRCWRSFALRVTGLWRRRLVGDIQHGVGGLHGFLDLADHQPFVTFDARHIQQGEGLAVQLQIVALGLAGEIGTTVADDFTVTQGLQVGQCAFAVLRELCALLYQRVFALLRFAVLDTQRFDSAVTGCSHPWQPLLGE